jgi:transcriptional regulator with XRE-family HTH domain
MKKGRPGVAKRRPREASMLANNLIALMSQKQITVRQAAEIAGVGHTTVVNWRGGALPEDFRAVRLLAKALGVSFSFLLTGEDDTRPNGAPSVEEIFQDGGFLFDGFAKITIQRLIPKSKKDEIK